MFDTDGLLTTNEEALDDVPLERLEAEITGFASRLAAATARWLVWIAAYDRRRGWETWETKSCAHWLNWHCGLSPRAAREHVHVARKLDTFHHLRATFLAGELSYSKVRAICRVIQEVNETELIDIARLTTAGQLDRIVAKMPRPDDPDTNEPPTTPTVEFRDNHDGTTTMIITAPTEDIAPAKATVLTTTDQIIDRHNTPDETKTATINRLGGLGTIRADVATSLICGTIDAPDNPMANVLIVADIDTLTGADTNAEATVDHQRVDAAVVSRLCCDGKIQAAILDPDGTERAVGSEQRIVPRRIRRLLLRRDHGMCQFPGCESEHRLHAHHIIHWEFGGPTELPNLISLCHFHHHSVHEGRWNITASTGDTGWTFHDRTGVPYYVPTLRLPTHTPLPDTTATRNGAAAPLKGLHEPADLHYIADVIATNTSMRKERARTP